MTQQPTGTQQPAGNATAGSLLERKPDELRAAAAAAGRQLPAGQAIVAGQPGPVLDVGDALAGPGAQALTVVVTGAATGTVTLVVAADVAAALQDGPLGAVDVTAALMTPVTDAVAEMEGAVAGALHIGVADAVEAHALEFGPGAAGVALSDGPNPVALLVVDLSVAGTVPAVGSERSAADDAASFTPFVDDGASTQTQRSLELLHDVEMAVTVELGRTRMAVSDLLSLAPGAVVELDRAAGSPVDVLVNGKLIARGEVVVIDDDFGIRISEIVGLQQNSG